MRGEGCMRLVKPLVRLGSKNWEKNLLVKLLQRKALGALKKESETELCVDDSSSDSEDEAADTIRESGDQIN